ncbi:MAG: hypothetical protein KF802_04255 [Bdellovibrionaceae bacterium]|nr:hypothetical protein [Pseudobdellovibrionaceae bacterium]
MGKVVPFSNMENFVNGLRSKGDIVRVILDTNVLIAASYEVKVTHEEITDLIHRLQILGVEMYATVTTKAEFMEFYRRLMLTEALADLLDAESKVRVPKAAFEEIRKAYASIKSKQARDGSDPIFNDNQIKQIKSEFSAGSHSGHIGWLKFCSDCLKGYVEFFERQLMERGISYLSPNDSTQASLFIRRLEWPVAAALVEKSGLSVSDAMILNMLNSSICQFSMSLDFDFGFAVRADTDSKDVLMPDRLEREYRHYHF